MPSILSYAKDKIDQLLAAKLDRPSGGVDGQVPVKFGSTTAWATITGGGSSSASDLTSGTLNPDRIADASLPAGKLSGTLSDSQIPAQLGGSRSFTSPLTVAAPTANSHSATKKYVDDITSSITAGTGPNRYYDGTVWQARGSSTNPVNFWSTKNATAPRPSDIAVGDTWVQHPDATNS